MADDDLKLGLVLGYWFAGPPVGVPEAIAARHQGMRVLGISCITNLAAGMSDAPINHEEVMETGARVAEVFKELLRRIVSRID